MLCHVIIVMFIQTSDDKNDVYVLSPLPSPFSPVHVKVISKYSSSSEWGLEMNISSLPTIEVAIQGSESDGNNEEEKFFILSFL